MQAPELKPVQPCQFGGEPPESVVVVSVCVGDKYPVEYVHRLYNMVSRNLTIPFRFVCITDRSINHAHIECYRPKNGFDGWWNKVEIFDATRFRMGQRCIYFDLDVVICDRIDDLVCVANDFVAVQNYSPNRARSAHNSSVMVWDNGGRASRIYDEFRPEIAGQLHGDQCWIWRCLESGGGYTIPNFPRNRIVSYKYDIKNHPLGCGDIDPQVVVFHGKPDPHEVEHPLVADNWK